MFVRGFLSAAGLNPRLTKKWITGYFTIYTGLMVMSVYEAFRKPIRERKTRSHYKLFVHLTWHIKKRLPADGSAAGLNPRLNPGSLTPMLVRECVRFVNEKCREIGVKIIAVNGVADHVHLLVSYPPQMAVTDMAHLLKGSLSRHINGRTCLGPLYWQDGYGAFSVSEGDLERVSEYIRTQFYHHRDKSGLVENPRINVSRGFQPAADM